MAIYHLHAKIISRKNNSHQDINSASDNQKGRSSTGAAAYRAGEKIVDERTKLIFDYSRKKGVIHAELILPQNSEWNPTRSELWNMVEFKNKREDSQVAREFEVALPVELTAEQRRELARSFAQEIANKYEIAADVCLHEPKEGENYHAHILTTTNKIEENGFGKKVRELDMIANARGEGKDKGKNEIDYIRERWETLTNDALARAGRDDVRIDCRTLEAQGIGREPTQHEGVAVTAMERKGIRTDIREENEKRKQRHQELLVVDEEISMIETQIADAKKEIVEAEQLEAEERGFQEAQESRRKLEAELKREEKLAQTPPQPVEPLNHEKLFVEYVRNQRRESGREFVSKNEPVGRFSSVTPPSPVEIYGYEATPHEDGSVFYHPKGKSSEVVFIDRQTSVEVFDKSDKTIVEMLNLSAKKWTDGFELTGSEEFRLRAEALAKKWGLEDKIKNPLNPAPKEELRPEAEKPKPITVPVREAQSEDSSLIDAPAEQNVDSLAADEEAEDIAEDGNYLKIQDLQEETVENANSARCSNKNHPIHKKMEELDEIFSSLQKQKRGTPVPDEIRDKFEYAHKLSKLGRTAAINEEYKQSRGR